MASVAAEATKLCVRFEGLRQRGTSIQDHINQSVTVRNKLLAIGVPVQNRQFTHKMLNVDKALYHVRATLAHATIDVIVGVLINAYAFMHMDGPPRHPHRHGHAGQGSVPCMHPRGSGAFQGAGTAVVRVVNQDCWP